MAKMKKFSFLISTLLLAIHLAYSRSIQVDPGRVSDGADFDTKNRSFLEWGLSASTETCEPVYGFLPCSSNVLGILFLIVVYNITLSVGGQYVGIGSNLFFEIIGPGVFGASLFQVLGTIPQTVLLLVPTLTGSREAAQQRVTSGMGLLVGTTAMLLTLIWGLSIVLGSYDLSVVNVATSDSSANQINILNGIGVVTDAETSYTARIMAFTLVPFIILLLANLFGSSGKRVILFIALIITMFLLLAYMLYQIFQPSIQLRRFEYLMNKYAKDKLLRLFSRNGRPDAQKIQQLFKSLDKNNSATVSAAELRVLLLGVKMDNDPDLSTERDVEIILASFDTSGDGRITQDEFIRGMTQLVSDLSDQNALSPKESPGTNSKNDSQAHQPLLANSAATTTTRRATNTWLNYSTAAFYVVFGTAILLAFGEALMRHVVGFAVATNLSSFWVSYLVIPFAMNYGAALGSVSSVRQKNRKSISLSLSALYGGVYMNNVMSLIMFLTPVCALNLSADHISTQVGVVLVICIMMTLLTSFRTTYPRWMGYVAVALYPISLAVVYLLTSVLGWS